MKNAEADVIRLTSGQDTGDMYYKTITGLKETLSQAHPTPAEQEQQPEPNGTEHSLLDPPGHESESSAEEDEDGEIDSEGSSLSETESQAPIDKKAARKENKKKVKEEKREARKTKVPKAVKKRKKKLSKAHKTR